MTLVPGARTGSSMASAMVVPTALDGLLKNLRDRGVPDEDIMVSRLEAVGQLAGRATEASVVWSDLLGAAWRQARPIGRYLAFMFVAGVIACYGVTDDNGILIVGAMAVSPDLLPIVAVGVGVVGRNLGLASRALLTLAVGFAGRDRSRGDLRLRSGSARPAPVRLQPSQPGVLGGLVSVNDKTIVVAFVAGVAGMLAFETRASSAIGVAISVTTIPAAAYLGVALGLGGPEQVPEALLASSAPTWR